MQKVAKAFHTDSCGRTMMSLRQGPPSDDRVMYPTHLDEIEKLAHSHGLAVTHVTRPVIQASAL